MLFVLCGLFSDVLSWTEKKKKKLIKKQNVPKVSWTDFCDVTDDQTYKTGFLLILRTWPSTGNKASSDGEERTPKIRSQHVDIRTNPRTQNWGCRLFFFFFFLTKMLLKEAETFFH